MPRGKRDKLKKRNNSKDAFDRLKAAMLLTIMRYFQGGRGIDKFFEEQLSKFNLSRNGKPTFWSWLGGLTGLRDHTKGSIRDYFMVLVLCRSPGNGTILPPPG